MEGVLTMAEASARLGVDRDTLTRALRQDAPELRVALLPAGEGRARGAWGIREGDIEEVRGVLERRMGRRGKGRVRPQKEDLGSSQADTA